MNPSPYRSLDDKYPYIAEQSLPGYGMIKFLMLNPRSESWYGTKDGIIRSNQEFLDLIKPGDRVIDAGANEGYLTVLAAAKVGKKGKVIAIEPARHNLCSLTVNVALNGFGLTVLILPAALSDSEPIRFSGERVDPAGFITETHRLDSLACSNVIKIDVEGWELKVLQGGQNMIEESRPVIFLETHLGGAGQVDMRQFGDTPEMLWNYLTGLDYEFFLDGRKLTGPEQIPNGAVVLKPK